MVQLLGQVEAFSVERAQSCDFVLMAVSGTSDSWPNGLRSGRVVWGWLVGWFDEWMVGWIDSS